MPIETDIAEFWSNFLTTSWLSRAGNNDAMQELAATTAGSIQTLARQIDSLRAELVAHGIDIDR